MIARFDSLLKTFGLSSLCILGIVSGAAASAKLSCDLGGDQIINYEKKILSAVEKVDLARITQKERTELLAQVGQPLECLRKTHQSGNPMASLAARNSFYALMGGEGPVGSGIEEKKLFQRFSLLLEAYAQDDVKSAQWFEGMVTEVVKNEWGTYKLFCVEGDTSHCLTFLPETEDFSDEKNPLSVTALLKWELAHKTLPIEHKKKLEERVRRLFETRENLPVLKRWFVERAYEKMVPTESVPVGFSLS